MCAALLLLDERPGENQSRQSDIPPVENNGMLSFDSASRAWCSSSDVGVCSICGSFKCLTMHFCGERFHLNTSLSL